MSKWRPAPEDLVRLFYEEVAETLPEASVRKVLAVYDTIASALTTTPAGTFYWHLLKHDQEARVRRAIEVAAGALEDVSAGRDHVMVRSSAGTHRPSSCRPLSTMALRR